MLSSEKLSELVRRKRDLVISFDRKEITEEEYSTKLGTLDSSIKEEQTRMLDESRATEDERYRSLKASQDKLMQESLSIAKANNAIMKNINKQTEEGNMPDEKKVDPVKADKPKKEKVVREKKVTKAAVIIKVLHKKGTKNMDNAVREVIEELPDAVEKNIRGQISSIIKLTKAGDKRFSKYIWNEEAFLMTDKPE